MTSLKSKESSAAKFSVFCLTVKQEPMTLLPDTSYSLCDGVNISTLKNSEEALLEIDSSKIEGQVLIDDRKVFEVAEVRPGQIITIQNQQFVILKPFQAFVNAKRNRSNDEVLIRSGSRPISQVSAHQAGLSTSKKGPNKTILLLSALILGLIALLVLVPAPSAKKSNKQTGADSVVPSTAEKVETESAFSLNNLENSKIVESPQEEGLAAPVTPVASETEKKASAQNNERSPEKKVIKASPKPEVSSPNREEAMKHKAYGKIQEYKLEARFDPNSAKQRLKDLIKVLPKNSAILREAEAALRGIP